MLMTKKNAHILARKYISKNKMWKSEEKALILNAVNESDQKSLILNEAVYGSLKAAAVLALGAGVAYAPPMSRPGIVKKGYVPSGIDIYGIDPPVSAMPQFWNDFVASELTYPEMQTEQLHNKSLFDISIVDGLPHGKEVLRNFRAFSMPKVTQIQEALRDEVSKTFAVNLQLIPMKKNLKGFVLANQLGVTYNSLVDMTPTSFIHEIMHSLHMSMHDAPELSQLIVQLKELYNEAQREWNPHEHGVGDFGDGKTPYAFTNFQEFFAEITTGYLLGEWGWLPDSLHEKAKACLERALFSTDTFGSMEKDDKQWWMMLNDAIPPSVWMYDGHVRNYVKKHTEVPGNERRWANMFVGIAVAIGWVRRKKK